MGVALDRVLAAALALSRWLMAPLYFGLIGALILLGAEFFVELWTTIRGFSAHDADSTILAVLKLIDLVLIGNLVLIMITAGIGTLGEIDQTQDKGPLIHFMGKMDFAALKLKVVVSLVAIASVDLLESFVDIAGIADKSNVLWEIAIIATFAFSGVLLAWMDRLAERHHAKPHE